MGWFDSIFGGDSNVDIGKRLLTAYYNEASQFSSFQHPSYDAFVAYLVARDPTFVEGLGDLVLGNYHSTSVGQAEDRMISLANQSEGTGTIGQLVQAAGGNGSTVNWWAMVPEATGDTISDLAAISTNVAQNVGTGVLGTLNMVRYLPFILIGGGALYLYLNSSMIKSQISSRFKK